MQNHVLKVVFYHNLIQLKIENQKLEIVAVNDNAVFLISIYYNITAKNFTVLSSNAIIPCGIEESK